MRYGASCRLKPASWVVVRNMFSYVVDAADQEKFETAKKELHELMAKPPLAGIPLLVLANKNDLPEALGVHDTIEQLYVSVGDI